MTDKQVTSLSKDVRLHGVELDWLISLTDAQAESLSKIGSRSLNGLTTITDELAESLSKVKVCRYLNGLTVRSPTGKHGMLSKIKVYLYLIGLTSITDKQASKALCKIS